MKRILLAATVISLGLMSCKKDKKDSVSIVGTWDFNKEVNWDRDLSSGIITKDTSLLVGTGSNVRFDADGKVYGTLVSPFGTFRDTSSYTINGNTIYFADLSTGDRDTSVIETLTANELTLKSTSTSPDTETQTWDIFTR